MMETNIYWLFVQSKSVLIGSLCSLVNDQENATTNTADRNVSNVTGGEFHQCCLSTTLSNVLFSASSESMAIDQMKELFASLQKKNDENFKHLNRKLEMKLGAGKVRSSDAPAIHPTITTASFVQFDLNNYRDSTDVPVATVVVSHLFVPHHSHSTVLRCTTTAT